MFFACRKKEKRKKLTFVVEESDELLRELGIESENSLVLPEQAEIREGGFFLDDGRTGGREEELEDERGQCFSDLLSSNVRDGAQGEALDCI